MTCKLIMVNIQIYSLVCNMLYFFKQIMISKTSSNFSQLFWISTQKRLGVLSKQKKIYRYWPKRVEKYGHIGKTPISCIPSNMHPKKYFFCCDFFFYPFLFQLFGQCIVFLLQLFVCFFLSLPTLLQWAHLCLQLLHPSQTLLLCPGCTQSNKTHNMSLFIMCI